MVFLNKSSDCLRRRTRNPAPDAEFVVALAGNPNVGKSTVFNRLTGLRQHTGNWPGKTVTTAEGYFEYAGKSFRVVDIPGMYSYSPHSSDEEAAVAFLCSGEADAVVVVCDACCLRRGVSFVLETAELTGNIIVCVNLTDEAERRGIRVDTRRMSQMLGMPVVSASAAHGDGIDMLAACVARECSRRKNGRQNRGITVRYPAPVEEKLRTIEKAMAEHAADNEIPPSGTNPRLLAVRLLSVGDGATFSEWRSDSGRSAEMADEVINAAQKCREELAAAGLDREKIASAIASRRILTADAICEQCILKNSEHSRMGLDRKLDRIFTGKISGRVCMLLLLCVVFWLTVTGANYPSEWLSGVFGRFEQTLRGWMEACGLPPAVKGLLVDGVYRVMTRIIAVMLPPMAIFFPLFALLEDSGYLPRAAFNSDAAFARCGACGKQALTSCMAFGCNAVGVTGCRIIDSPRERIIAVITNSFIPCNGRFPILTAFISMFFLGSIAAPFGSLLSAGLLTGLICLGVAVSLGVSKLLSVTLLKGEPSSFTLELPPYRRPMVGSVILHSVTDRIVFVLGRAVAVAAPAGALIWITANVTSGGEPLLTTICHCLDPIGRFLGMDGVILAAFILGLPANETVIPLMIMAYMAQGNMSGLNDAAAIHALLLDNGWNVGTAVCVMLFTLMHWPCATTCITIYRETRSLKWTALSVVIPTLTGCAVCALAAAVFRLFG